MAAAHWASLGVSLVFGIGTNFALDSTSFQRDNCLFIMRLTFIGAGDK